MKTSFVIALLSVFAIASAAVIPNGYMGFPEEDGVTVLDNKNYDEAMGKFSKAMIEFYAPWCGHCKALAPEYSKAAKNLRERGVEVAIVKVDAEANPELGTKFEVEGYPTLKWYSNGKYSDYDGKRTAADILKWVDKRTGPPSKPLHSKADLDAAQHEHAVMVVFFGEDGDDFKRYQEFAGAHDDMSFFHSFNSGLVGEMGGSRVTLFKKFDEGRNDLTGDWTTESLEKFIEDNRWEIVMQFKDESSIDRIFSKEKPAVFLFQVDEGEWTSEFRKAAENMRQEIIFTSLVSGGEIATSVMEYIGVQEKDCPTVRILATEGGEVANYTFSEAITSENIQNFVRSWKDGKLTRTYKSEAVPEVNNKPVKVVVGKTWDEMVINNDKDVLVEFYAPWCGHCQSLEPKYEKLAVNMLRMGDHLVIAKLDATQNDVPGLQIESFPTIYLFKNGDKKNPKEYTGGRTVKAMSKFLKKSVSFTWVPLHPPELRRDQVPTPVETPEGEAAASAEL